MEISITSPPMPSIPQPLRSVSTDKIIKRRDDHPTTKSKSPSIRQTTSRSTKLASGIPRQTRKPTSLKRRRVLKHIENRGIAYAAVEYKHFPYIWAAAKRGVFDIGESTADEFKGELSRMLADLVEKGGEGYIGMARKDDKDIPVCLCLIEYQQNRAYPTVWWFPEATPRNKIELSVKFLIALKAEFLVLIPAKEHEVAYFSHLCKYGLLRKCGTIREYFPDGKAVLFQSV